MPVHAVQQLSDSHLVPLALLAGELQQNIPIPVVGNMREKVCEIPARGFDQGQGGLDRSLVVGQRFYPVSLVVGVADKGTARPSKGPLKDHQEHSVDFGKVEKFVSAVMACLILMDLKFFVESKNMKFSFLGFFTWSSKASKPLQLSHLPSLNMQ